MGGRKPREQDLLRTCLAWLQVQRIPAWRNNTGCMVLGVGEARRYFRAGMVGSSDIFGVLPPSGRFLAVECKRRPNKPTPEQLAFLENVRAAGGLGLVVYSLEELIEGIPCVTTP